MALAMQQYNDWEKWNYEYDFHCSQIIPCKKLVLHGKKIMWGWKRWKTHSMHVMPKYYRCYLE